MRPEPEIKEGLETYILAKERYLEQLREHPDEYLCKRIAHCNDMIMILKWVLTEE
jgi:hypothetical protein